MLLLALFLAVVFAWSLVSKRLERSIVTAPIAFTAAGALIAILTPEVHVSRSAQGTLLHIAELGLVLLLFTDASRADLRLLGSTRSLPLRLLGIGMPLTIALGLLAALAVIPELSLWEAGILAAILAPTDAGLGQAIVNSPRVPAKLRQALNVEAGLNDGLSVPFLLFFMAVLESGLGGDRPSLVVFLWEQLGLGLLIGLGLGWGGGRLLGLAERRGTVAESWQPLGVVVLPLICLLVSDHFSASMFIAAFVAGLAVQKGFARASAHAVEFAEGWGQLFNLAVFFLFGLVVPGALGEMRWEHGAYALLSLTVVRMLPVALALLGARLAPATIVFAGWFGPRGLASIVLGLVYLEAELESACGADLRLAVVATVLSSIVLHGVTATPGAELYARRVLELPSDAPERAES
jgi:NhaP-type Na+/H+ or K+/H+ antiporter